MAQPTDQDFAVRRLEGIRCVIRSHINVRLQDCPEDSRLAINPYADQFGTERLGLATRRVAGRAAREEDSAPAAGGARQAQRRLESLYRVRAPPGHRAEQLQRALADGCVAMRSQEI